MQARRPYRRTVQRRVGTTRYDVCVIGAGPGGFAAATRAAQRGARVCLVEERELGGTCLNRGCIPARAIGTTAWLASVVQRSHTLGIRIGQHEVVWPDALARKDRIVRRLREGLKQLVQARKIELVPGRAALAGAGRVEVTSSLGGAAAVIEAGAIVVSTGSSPAPLPMASFDGRRVISSDELLQAPALPKRLVVIGGGVIGCEFASYLAPLGVEVTVLEREPQLLPGQDADLAQELAATFTRVGVRVHTGALVTAVVPEPPDVVVQWGQGQRLAREEALPRASAQEVRADQVLLTVGRRPNTRGMGLAEAGVTLTPSGHVRVDQQLRTSVPQILAVGDVLGQYQTAYTASYEGTVAAENALGGSRTVDYAAVPECIFTLPEIAAVGMTEAQARTAGHPIGVSRVPWTISGRALTLDETEGFVKVVYHQETQQILGVQMMGPRATDLIAEATVAIQRGLTLQALVDVLHGHPTLAEGLWEASAQPLMQALYVR